MLMWRELASSGDVLCKFLIQRPINLLQVHLFEHVQIHQLQIVLFNFASLYREHVKHYDHSGEFVECKIVCLMIIYKINSRLISCEFLILISYIKNTNTNIVFRVRFRTQRFKNGTLLLRIPVCPSVCWQVVSPEQI